MGDFWNKAWEGAKRGIDPTRGPVIDYLDRRNDPDAQAARNKISAEEAAAAQAELDAPAVDGSLDGVNPDQAEATGVVMDLGGGAGGPARKVEPDYQWDADPEFAQMPGSMKRFAESGQNAVELGGEAAQQQLSARDEQIAAGEKFVGETEARMAELAAQRAAAKEENRQRIKDLENQNSIADAYYKDKANKAEWNSLISRFFGSFYAAVGKPELAVKNAENAIREEMQAKEHAFNVAQAGIGRKQTLYGLYKQQYQDDDQAALALEIDTRSIAAQKLSLIAEKTNSPAMAKAAEALLEKNRSAMALQENLLFRSSRDYHATPEMMAKHGPKMGADSVPSREQDANINVIKREGAPAKAPPPPQGAAPLGALSGQGGRMASPPERTQPAPGQVAGPSREQMGAPPSSFAGTQRSGFVSPNAQYGRDREQVTASGERFIPLTGKDVPEGIRRAMEKKPGEIITPPGYKPLDAGNGRFYLVPEHEKELFQTRARQKSVASLTQSIYEKMDKAEKLVNAYGAYSLTGLNATTQKEASKDEYQKARKDYIDTTQALKTQVGQLIVAGTKAQDKGAIHEAEANRTLAGLKLEDIGSRFGTYNSQINGEDMLRFRAAVREVNNMVAREFNSGLVGVMPARQYVGGNGSYAYFPLQNSGNYGNVKPDNRVTTTPSNLSKK